MYPHCHKQKGIVLLHYRAWFGLESLGLDSVNYHNILHQTDSNKVWMPEKSVVLEVYVITISQSHCMGLNYHLFGNKATKFDFIHQTVTYREVRMGWA